VLFQGEDYVYKEPVQQPLTAAYQDILKKTSQVNIKYEGIRVMHDEELFKEWYKTGVCLSSCDDNVYKNTTN